MYPYKIVFYETVCSSVVEAYLAGTRLRVFLGLKRQEEGELLSVTLGLNAMLNSFQQKLTIPDIGASKLLLETPLCPVTIMCLQNHVAVATGIMLG